jgi:hypothetical protein
VESEFSGIERRLDELAERLARLHPLSEIPEEEFDDDLFDDLVRFADLIRVWLRQRSSA